MRSESIFSSDQGNDLLKEQARDVGRLSDAGIADDIQVDESSQAQRRAQAAASGFFHVEVDLRIAA